MSRRRPSSTITSRKLVAALRAAGADLEGDDAMYVIRRLYPGAGWRSGGAWSWSLEYPTWVGESAISAVAANTGSIWPVKDLLKHGLTVDADGIGYKVHQKGY